MPVTDAEEAALVLKRTPGGVESLPDSERASVENVHDEQFDRAEDLLKGILLYDTLAAPKKIAAK